MLLPSSKSHIEMMCEMFKLRSFCENKDNNYSFYNSKKSVYDNN
ncbi:TPA: hypothetical protein OYK40_002644 [Staphylococcus aureus]|nr:hypothetical protein [Staphylococcus aureus]MCG5704134.1 hypothetical protein [Staphylococcus aureus]WIZ98315.1 hypothetical protein PCL23_06725 [Staphylococcus aureus]HCW8778913.1 hypothetical protein [Staphylococcus aureus]HDK9648813.1 hypothetical protein [Staphylococcus aureus]HDK9649941.1 hypothetical protein [Staphylococcus aureus]